MGKSVARKEAQLGQLFSLFLRCQSHLPDVSLLAFLPLDKGQTV